MKRETKKKRKIHVFATILSGKVFFPLNIRNVESTVQEND